MNYNRRITGRPRHRKPDQHTESVREAHESGLAAWAIAHGFISPDGSPAIHSASQRRVVERHRARATPEQRIAADLGLTTADLDRIVRHERARRLGPRMEEALRGLLLHGPKPKGIRMDYHYTLHRAEAGRILTEIDAPTH